MANSNSRGPFFGKRHVLIFLACLGYAISHMQRHSFPITMRAMVNASMLPQPSIDVGDCPDPNNLSTSIPRQENDGVFIWTHSFQSHLHNIYRCGTVLPQILVGTLAQRVGGKWFFLTGMLMRSVFFLVTPFLSWWWSVSLLPSRFLEGFGDGMTYASFGAMLGRWTPREEVTLMSAVQFYGPTTGNLIANILTGYLVSWPQLGGWPEVFYLYAGVVTLWIPLWIACIANSPSGHRWISGAERLFISHSLGSTRQSVVNKSYGVPWRKVFTDRAVWILCLCSFGTSLVSLSLTDHVPQFLKNVVNVNIQDNAVLFALPSFCVLIGSIAFSACADAGIDRWPGTRTNIRKATTMAACLGAAAGLITVVALGCRADLIILIFVFSAGFFSLINCGVRALPLDLSPEFSGTLYGLSGTFSATAGILTQFLVGLIEDGSRTSWTSILLVEAGFAVATGVLILATGPVDRRQWTTHLELELCLEERIRSFHSEKRKKKDWGAMSVVVH